jgi:hypothetical protein
MLPSRPLNLVFPSVFLSLPVGGSHRSLLRALSLCLSLSLARLYRRAGVPRAWWPTGIGWVGHALAQPTLGALAAEVRTRARRHGGLTPAAPMPRRGVSNITNIKHHRGVSLQFCAERWRLKQRAGWYATLGGECERGWVLMRARAAARACGHGTRRVADLVKK